MTNFIATWIAPIIAVLALLALIIIAIKAIAKKNSKTTNDATETDTATENDATETVEDESEETETEEDGTDSSEETSEEKKSTMPKFTRTIAKEADKKAEEAKAEAEEAKVIATEAKTEAEEAKVIAEGAKVIAEGAKVIATEAKTEAEEAKVIAEGAVDSSKKTAAAVARLTNPDVVSEIDANMKEIDKLVDERCSHERILRGANARLPKLEENVTKAQTAENEARDAYETAQLVLSAAEERVKLASKKLDELPHDATADAKTAAQAEVDAAKKAVGVANASCQAAKYAYEETFEQKDPTSDEVVERTLCAKDAKVQAVAARDAVVAEAAKAQDEIDRINGKIKRLEDANKELKAKLNG